MEISESSELSVFIISWSYQGWFAPFPPRKQELSQRKGC